MGTKAVRSRSPVHDVCALWVREQSREQDVVLQRGQVYLEGWVLQMAQSAGGLLGPGESMAVFAEVFFLRLRPLGTGHNVVLCVVGDRFVAVTRR